MMTFTLGWPQIIYLCLATFGLIYATVKHGQVKEGSQAIHNAWSQLTACLLGFSLLYWGGFFTPCG